MKIKSLVVTVVLVTTILCFGVVVKAQTTDVSALIAQLQAQVQALMQQIAQLQAQQGTTPTPTPTPVAWCYTFNNNFGIGANTNDLNALLTVLAKENIYKPTNKPTQYNSAVISAVIKLQQKYKILATGFVGTLTRIKLNTLYGCAIIPPPSITYTQCSNQKCVTVNGTGTSQCSKDSDCMTACTPNWTCGWGPCTNGTQSQVASDSNNCGLPPSSANIVCPALTKTCVSPVANTISACGEITQPGNYSISQDIIDSAQNDTCLKITSAQNVTLNCGGHKIIGYNPLSIDNSSAVTIQSCTMDSLPSNQNSYNAIVGVSISNGNNINFINNTFNSTKQAGYFFTIYATDSSGLSFNGNTINGVYRQEFSTGSNIKNNNFYTPVSNQAGSGSIILSFGSSNQATGNSIDGGSDLTSQKPNGDDNGLQISDESNDVVSNNTFKNIYNTGIETYGLVQNSTIYSNTFNNIGGAVYGTNCVFGGWYFLSMIGNTYSNNTAQNVRTLFCFNYSGGLRPASVLKGHNLPADETIYFKDNKFKNNTLNPSADSNNSFSYFNPLPFPNPGSGSLPASASNIIVGNNIFSSNNFGGSEPNIKPDSLAVDGGGNICSNTGNQPNYPLNCNSACTPNWNCSGFGICANSHQMQTCTDSNNCGVTTGEPALTQSCTTACVPNWTCATWSTCTNNNQTRTCTDANNCGVTTNQPTLTQTCTSITQPSIIFVSPTSGSNSAQTIITVNGNGFQNSNFLGWYNSNTGAWMSSSSPISFSGAKMTFMVVNLPQGTYQIGITSSTQNLLSNTVPFTINAPAVGLNASQINLASISDALKIIAQEIQNLIGH